MLPLTHIVTCTITPVSPLGYHLLWQPSRRRWTPLQGIPNVISYIDDILVTGANDRIHLRKLAEVLQWLQQHWIKLSKAKCSFMQPSVDYLGHQVDAEGLHMTADKVEAL